MSVLTALSAARLQVAELLRTRCVGCGHRLSDHRLSAPVYDGDARAAGPPACNGEMRTGKRPRCRCKGFAEPGEK